MLNAPKGSVYVWVTGDLGYPTRLAREIGREDLQIVRRSALESDRYWNGRRLLAVVIDHAVLATLAEYDTMRYLRSLGTKVIW